MEISVIKKIAIEVLKNYPAVVLFYFFGSKANGNEGPLSDYDFACFFNEKDRRKISGLQLGLREELSRALETDKIDLVVLNTAASPELKYRVIAEGQLLFEREPFKILVEPKIINDYCDFRAMLLRYGLTAAP